MSTGGDGLRGLSALLAIVGGLAIVVMWGLYASIWAIVGVILLVICIMGALMIWRKQELDGVVPVVASAIVGYYLYPPLYMPGLFVLVIIALIISAVMAIVAFEIDR